MYPQVAESDCRELFSVINQMKDEGPLTAQGFFTVDRPLLVSLLSTVLTYIIILVQFDAD